jgi:DNA replication protein DnaC
MLFNQTIEKMAGMRLKDMAAEYRRQSELPAMDALSFEERFSLMVEAEWLARQNRRLSKLTRDAHLPEPGACLEDVDYDPRRKIDRAQIARLSDCGWVRDRRHLLITGKTGTGKTWLATAFADAACRRGMKVRCYKTLRLLNDLTLGRADGTWADVIDDLLRPDLLVLDDFGMEPLGALHCRDLFEVVDERRSRGSLLIAAQHPVKDWHAAFADKTAADAVMDRIVNNSHRIELEGPSRRGIDRLREPAGRSSIQAKKEGERKGVMPAADAVTDSR